MSNSQKRLLALLKEGWTCVIYRDDPRTRYFPPDKNPAGALRGNAHTVVSLLYRGLIKVVRHEPGATVYAIDQSLVGKPPIEVL